MNSPLNLKTDTTGVLLPVHAQPKAARNTVTNIHNGRLKVTITAAPERGKANAAILKILAKSLGLKKSQLELIAGDTAPKKTIRVSGVDLQTLQQRIHELVDSS